MRDGKQDIIRRMEQCLARKRGVKLSFGDLSLLLRSQDQFVEPHDSPCGDDRPDAINSTSSGQLAIRWLIRRDMPEVIAIENDSSESPWTDEDFICCLRGRNVIGMVAEDRRRVVRGFMIYELHRQRLYLLKLAVDPSMRFQGVGRRMIERLIDKLSMHSMSRRNEICADVCGRNTPAHLFFKSMGFRATGISSSGEDDFYEFRYQGESCPRNAMSEGPEH